MLLGVKVLTKRDAEPTLYSLMEYIVMLDLVGGKSVSSALSMLCLGTVIPRTRLRLVHGCENFSVQAGVVSNISNNLKKKPHTSHEGVPSTG